MFVRTQSCGTTRIFRAVAGNCRLAAPNDFYRAFLGRETGKHSVGLFSLASPRFSGGDGSCDFILPITGLFSGTNGGCLSCHFMWRRPRPLWNDFFCHRTMHYIILGDLLEDYQGKLSSKLSLGKRLSYQNLSMKTELSSNSLFIIRVWLEYTMVLALFVSVFRIVEYIFLQGN